MIVVNPRSLDNIRYEMGFADRKRTVETTVEFFKEHNIQLDMYKNTFELWVLTFDTPRAEVLFRLRFSEYLL